MPRYSWQRREGQEIKLEKIGSGQIMKGLEFEFYFGDKGECEIENSEEKSWRWEGKWSHSNKIQEIRFHCNYDYEEREEGPEHYVQMRNISNAETSYYLSKIIVILRRIKSSINLPCNVVMSYVPTTQVKKLVTHSLKRKHNTSFQHSLYSNVFMLMSDLPYVQNLTRF